MVSFLKLHLFNPASQPHKTQSWEYISHNTSYVNSLEKENNGKIFISKMKLFPCYIAIAIATPKIKKWLPKGTSPAEKNVFFRGLPELPLPPPPNSDTFLQLFLDVKNDVLMRIAELSKGSPPEKKNVFFWALPEFPLPPPLPPIWATCTTFFGRQKRRFSAYYRTK